MAKTQKSAQAAPGDIHPPAGEGNIQVCGARIHNLRNIDVTIPRGQLTVITGLSGSGKSSLAFDTIFAEGQRRYIETFPSYARQFLGVLERPDVDTITGLSPVVSIEQKTVNKNPRSTVGTITEIYDYLRLLYAKVADAFSPATGLPMAKHTEGQILEMIATRYAGQAVYLLAPIVRGRKGHYRDLFEQLRLKGFLQARVDGELRDIMPGMMLDRYAVHHIELVVDKLVVESGERLRRSARLALDQGKGVAMVWRPGAEKPDYFSRHLMCPATGLSYLEPQPFTFSFNSPVGACPRCKGLGQITVFDTAKIFPDPALSIRQGAIAPLGKMSSTVVFWQIEALAKHFGTTLETPFRDLPADFVDALLNGVDFPIRLEHTPLGSQTSFASRYPGIAEILDRRLEESDDDRQTLRFYTQATCPECGGARLRPESLHFKIDGLDIAQASAMDLAQLAAWTEGLADKLSERKRLLGGEIIKEIRQRAGFLLEVGLGYLSLDRGAATLSGGESQRIRLATQIGARLVNVLYILDEPSIGLHQRDNRRLIASLKSLRDLGNSVVVVEHDREMMQEADYIIDIGPGAGRRGGNVCAAGTYAQVAAGDSVTARYLSGRERIEVPKERRAGNGLKISLKGCAGHNLQGVDVDIPLGMFVCVTGVSGSGKSSLVNETLQPILAARYHHAQATPLPYESVEGLEHLDKVIEVDQSPIGRSPRSNPATYTGIFNEIRSLFARLPESNIRNFKPGRFSFNVKGGRCETCRGAGVQTVEMNFLPSVYVTCPDCRGRRYNRETLEVRFKGRSIGEVLDMTINQAAEFFAAQPKLLRPLQMLQRVGLGYVKLGQPSTTLSGGESQRLKLSAELSRPSTGRTLYILDEPTTGLHFEDIRVLLQVFGELLAKGNSLVVIEHNMDIIKSADYIIDIGPDGGRGGGHVVATGTPEQVAASGSVTGEFLRQELEG